MLITILVTIILVALMVGLNALYVAGEFSAVKARKSRIAQAAKGGNRLAKMLLPILQDGQRLDNYIAASQVGITLSSIVLGIYGQQQVAPLLEPLLGYLPFVGEETATAGIAAVLMLIVFTTLQFVFGELIPKSLAIQYPERVATATVIPMRWSADYILRPLIILLNGSGTLLLKLLGVGHGEGHAHVHSPEEIQLLIEQSYKGGVLDARGQELLQNAFRIGDLTVGEIDVPRTQMDAISVDLRAREALQFAIKSRHTRIPVYQGNLDQILGFVHLKDLFRLYHTTDGEGAIDKIVRKVSVVPETTPVKEVVDILKEEANYLAVVVDEFGVTTGMVTQEDLLEELFGELQDEFDEGEEPLISPAGEGEFLIRGNTPISYLNSRFHLSLPEQHVHTAGGLIYQQLKRVPRAGDTVSVGSVQMTVEKVERKAVHSIRFRLPDAARAAGTQAQGGA